MTFLSIKFAILLIITIAAYFTVGKKYRWAVLLIASYVFYWFNSSRLVVFLLIATVVTFVIGKVIYRVQQDGKEYIKANEGLTREERKKYNAGVKKKTNTITTIGVIIDLGILLVLKYYNFFAGNINIVLNHFGTGLPKLSLLLPLGISFYTLQAVAYLVDINHGKLKPDDNIFKFMLFMSFFPQIIQGPIARHDQLAAQLYEGHAFDYTRVTHGFQLILWGAVKKLIIADRLLIPVATVFENYSNYEGGILLFGAALYGLQVYTDFSGGMDIAQGIAQIFGIQLEINFRQPYFSVSIEDFWRRWHITLGGWMRDYIFFPLSLSKRFATISRNSRKVFGPFVGKRLPAILSSFVVYFLVGFWHGAE